MIWNGALSRELCAALAASAAVTATSALLASTHETISRDISILNCSPIPIYRPLNDAHRWFVARRGAREWQKQTQNGREHQRRRMRWRVATGDDDDDVQRCWLECRP